MDNTENTKYLDLRGYGRYLAITALVLVGGFFVVASLNAPAIPKAHQYTESEFFEACKKNDTAVVATILKQHFIYPSTAEADRSTPLHVACVHGSKEVVILLLADKRVNLNARDIYGKTPLHRTVETGMHEVISLLLASKKLDPNIADEKKRTPFEKACMIGEIEIVSLLLADKRVNLNTVDIYGKTPLFMARHHSKELAKLLEDDPRVEN